ncbi:MAG: transcription-repair coupling factor [Leptospiraceae bacterium]|nr:transcription-repair coupling factor [Leptospiraceae bacterium]
MFAMHQFLEETRPALIITSAVAMMRRMPLLQSIADRRLELRVGDCIALPNLIQGLVEIGYHRVPRIEQSGEFSVRGEIVDVYPVQLDKPLRLEFFDDELERLQIFDIDSQLSHQRIDAASVFAAAEYCLDPAASAQLQQRIETHLADPEVQPHLPAWVASAAAQSDAALNQHHHPGLHELVPLLFDTVTQAQNLNGARYLILEADKVLEQSRRLRFEYEQAWQTNQAQLLCPSVAQLLGEFDLDLQKGAIAPDGETWLVFERPRFTHKDMAAALSDSAQPESAEADQQTGAQAAEAPDDSFHLFRHLPGVANPFGSSEIFFAEKKIGALRERLKSEAREGHRIILCTPYESQMQRVAQVFESDRDFHVTLQYRSTDSSASAPPPGSVNPAATDVAGRKPRKKAARGKAAAKLVATDNKVNIEILQSAMSSGFRLKAPAVIFLSDNQFFGRAYKRRSRFKRLASRPIDSFLDLKEGDFVVHVNHGVGRFVKLEKVKAAGRERDFLILNYADDDRLYVPLDQISLVQRYVAPTEKPRLDHLGRASFKKVRARVEERIAEFAEELMKVYAIRNSRKGYALPADSIWQDEFEASFPFEETPDQLLAIEAVKRDLESDRPMDRLICGDVGFGKTEVAIRAAFKCAMAGRQVALIAPTTILAMQHFRTLQDRFQDYPLTVDWVSRFRTAKEIRLIRQQLTEGTLDVLVGTHALLSSDYVFKSLGLLVIDEEQRFGVRHKEAIKKLRAMVDVMTLSATPIPRTLHMSMTGIRDLSIIQTPPLERRPVETYVIEDNDILISQAIQRELDRGGQVFYLHNRIQTIENLALRLRQLLPHITLDVLHGQMSEDEIEDRLIRFTQGRFDVLVTTAIIENGIDMPNVNTLIVDRADSFGLSQLYQIRGRVGRGDRQAYALFLYPPGRALTEAAAKRLNTILEYQELGSGFKIAMRDLEQRGAGNILGKEQSGHIIEVGYELYIKLLNEAVRKLQGQEILAEIRCAVNLKTDFYLPADYIQDVRDRISFYKRFESATGADEVNELAAELIDRYGRLPDVAKVFVAVEGIRAMASLAGFERVYEMEDGSVELVASSEFRLDLEHLVGCIQSDSALGMRPGKNNCLIWKTASGRSNPDVLDLEALHRSMAALVAPLAQRAKVVSADASRQGIGLSA